MELTEAKQKFIQTWGMLGSSWGINRTMAQIHALLLVAPHSLSAEEIMEELQVSRGNANMNLRALIDWNIVYKEIKPGERKEFFHTEKDIWKLAREVTKQRRKREIEPVLKTLKELQELKSDKSEEAEEFKHMTKELLNFTEKIDGTMDKFERSDDHWFYKNVLKLMK